MFVVWNVKLTAPKRARDFVSISMTQIDCHGSTCSMPERKDPGVWWHIWVRLEIWYSIPSSGWESHDPIWFSMPLGVWMGRGTLFRARAFFAPAQERQWRDWCNRRLAQLVVRYMGGFHGHAGYPNSWMAFVGENPNLKCMIWGTPISGNLYIYIHMYMYIYIYIYK